MRAIESMSAHVRFRSEVSSSDGSPGLWSRNSPGCKSCVNEEATGNQEEVGGREKMPVPAGGYGTLPAIKYTPPTGVRGLMYLPHEYIKRSELSSLPLWSPVSSKMFQILFLWFSLLSFPSPALLRILPMRGWSNEVEATHSCAPCQEERCPPAPQRCPAGRVKDRCGCCWECANVEGQMCDLPWMKHQFGTCGEDLRCQVKVGHSEEPKCICPSQESVCGTDRRTYKNICRLQEAARTRLRTELKVVHTGPCQEAPRLLSSPRDTASAIGQTVILGCEVSAQPMAEMEWRKEGIEGPLPGDSGHIIVQSRGGPQRHHVTSWLQIHNVRERDAGSYTCHGRNMYGEVTASARLTVISPDSLLAPEVSGHLIGVFDVTDDEDYLREGPSGSHE